MWLGCLGTCSPTRFFIIRKIRSFVSINYVFKCICQADPFLYASMSAASQETNLKERLAKEIREWHREKSRLLRDIALQKAGKQERGFGVQMK